MLSSIDLARALLFGDNLSMHLESSFEHGPRLNLLADQSLPMGISFSDKLD